MDILSRSIDSLLVLIQGAIKLEINCGRCMMGCAWLREVVCITVLEMHCSGCVGLAVRFCCFLSSSGQHFRDVFVPETSQQASVFGMFRVL